MTLKLLILSLASISFIACSESNDTNIGSPTIKDLTYTTEGSLPNGDWTGFGTSSKADGGQALIKSNLSIRNNVLTQRFDAKSGRETTIDRFQYQGDNLAHWFADNGKKIGFCECLKQSCYCEGFEENLRIEMTMTFSKNGLEIEEKGSSGKVGYEQNFSLKPQR